MLAAAGLLLIGPMVVAAPPGPPKPLVGPALTAALTKDGEANYRPTVHYDMEVRLDPATKKLDASARVTWKNDGKWPVSVLWWHLYLNAFRNEDSTFIRESGGRLRGDRMREDGWGWTDVLEMTARDLSQTGTSAATRHDLLPNARFAAPDDGNEADRTVLTTALPFRVKPGGRVEIKLRWEARLPKVFARTGYAGTFFMVGQWFPKLGVLEESFRGPERDDRGEPKWNCHQFHATTEFFADYGSYRVKITVPNDYVVGATGQRVEDPIKNDGWTTYEYFQDRVHDFAWTADRRYLTRRFTFNPAGVPAADTKEAADALGLKPQDLRLSPVEVTMLLQPEHREFAARYRDAVEQGLKWFGLWFGRYPYATLTVVDGPPEGSGAMGMEYPTLITGGVRWPSPPALQSPEGVTVHEFAHQFWYGLVASNEFEEAWLDEGLTTFSTSKVMDKVYGPSTFGPRILGVPMVPWGRTVKIESGDIATLANIIASDTDAIVQPAWTYRSSLSYGANSYGRADLAMRQLGALIGSDKVLQGLRVYQQRWRYRHPTTSDLRAVMEEVSGRSLRDFFETAMRRPVRLDYAIDSLTSKRRRVPAGVFDRTTGQAGAGADDAHVVISATTADARTEDVPEDARIYVNEVKIARRGERVVPVVIEVEMSDGPPHRALWDGAGRWHRVRFESKQKAVSARLYAETPRPIDARPSNDTRTRESDPSVGLSWAARSLYWLQTAIQIVGGLL